MYIKMTRTGFIFWFAACLLFPLTSWAEEQTMQQPDSVAARDYIKASLLVIEPAADAEALNGLCALRIQCQKERMDYCFTFQTNNQKYGPANFFKSQLKGGFSNMSTTAFLEAQKEAGHGVKQYALNLSCDEKVQLWQVVDQELALGYNRTYDYLHTQSTSMIVYLINRALSQPIEYNTLDGQAQRSLRDRMLASASNPWNAFIWQTVMGTNADSIEPLTYLLTPQQLPAVMQQATVGQSSRHLITTAGETLVEALKPAPANKGLTPTLLFSLLLLVTLCITVLQLRKRCWTWLPLALDVLLLVVHTVVSMALLWLVNFTQQEATTWNWYLVVFNPLPLLLWLCRPRWRQWVCRCTLLVWAVFILLTPFIPQLDLPHALFVACLALRLAMKAFEKK